MAVPKWERIPVLSGRTATRLAAAADGPMALSLDLGQSESAVRVEGPSVLLPDGQRVVKSQLAEAFSDPEDCILIRNGACEKVYRFSAAKRRYYKLYQPFEGKAPTIVVNSATMHAIVGKDPWQDTADKVGALPARFGGQWLDTCCGLGYSAQMLARRGFGRIVTCEVDANVLDVAAVNPYSQGLFGDERIAVEQCDLRKLVSASPDGSFACIFHDPPTVYQAGELYAESLYREFARVLAPGGVLYHYVGAPGVRRGQDYAAGVIRRMQAAGLVRTRRVTSGVIAFAPGR